MTLRKAWPYPCLLVLWIGLASWLWYEHQNQLEQSRHSLRRQGRVIIETVAASIRSQGRMAIHHPQRLEILLEEVVSHQEIVAIALIDEQGTNLATAGDETKLAHSLLAPSAEIWQGNSLQLWSAISVGPMSPKQAANAPKQAANTPKQAASKKVPARFRVKKPNPPQIEKYWLTLLLASDSLAGMEAMAMRLRLAVAAMSFIILFGLAFLWQASIKRLELHSSLKIAEKQNQYLRETNLAANGLAHETKNPLNTLRMTAETLLTGINTDSGWAAKLQLIIDEVDRLTNRINEWLNFARPREPKVAATDLAALFSELSRLIAYDVKEKQVTLATDHGGLGVLADREMLRQLLFNLLLNGIQAVACGGRIQMTACLLDTRRVSITVADNGAGVPEQHRDKLFFPYFTTREHGSGLGLAICRQIAHVHGWDITYKPATPGSYFVIDYITPVKEQQK